MSNNPHQPTPTLDFSIYHPLDHWPWEQRCRDHYGGWRNHLMLEWQYRQRDRLERMLLCPVMLVACRLGKHRVTTWRRGRNHPAGPGYITFCNFCGYHRPAREDEKFATPHWDKG